MDGFLATEATGFAGGIWLLWDMTKIQVDPFVLNDQMIMAAISCQGRNPFLLSIIYASPNPSFRLQLWEYIKTLGTLIDVPWLLLGDFNQVVAACDKRGGRPFRPSKAQPLIDMIQECHLLDLGFQGPQFTWTNGRKGLANIRERIDRAWCNLAWHHHFESAWVRHVVRAHSDHHSILLGGLAVHPPVRFRGFRFLEAWFSHPEFTSTVEALWTEEPSGLSKSFANLKNGLLEWNRITFRNIFERKKRCNARLLGIQRSLEFQYKPSLAKLGRQLQLELAGILEQEESFWRQKARCKWHTAGEQNTRYFHATVVARQRQNHIV